MNKLGEMVKSLENRKESVVPSQEELVVVEPEHRNATGVICLLSTQTPDGQKFVMLSLPVEDYNGLFTKAEKGDEEDGVIFLNPEMLAFPSGAVDQGEDVSSAIAREIAEEDEVVIEATRVQPLAMPEMKIFQSTVGNYGSYPIWGATSPSKGFGFLRMPREAVDKPHSRYGYYDFTLQGVSYDLAPQELEKLQMIMSRQGRQLAILTKQEIEALGPYAIRPSSKRFFTEYCKSLERH